MDSSLDYKTSTYYEEIEKMDIDLPWIRYKKEEENNDETSDSSTSPTSSEKKVKDSQLLSMLKKYGFLIILKKNITFSDGESIMKNLFTDASNYSDQ